ncbi:MAG: Lrp/AsnC family transcriptional regulator [Novosphingobium sp.]
MPKSAITFSDTDHAIVAELRRNGRSTNQQIADSLGLTASTVSSRIRRMEDANQLRVVAVSDFAALGYHVLMRIAVDVDGRATSEVADELAQFPEIFACHIVTGRHDIDILVGLHEFADLPRFLETLVSQVSGIRALIPSITLDIVKYDFEVAPLEGMIR